MRERCSSGNGEKVSDVVSERSATSDASPPEQESDAMRYPERTPPWSRTLSVSTSSVGVSTVATPQRAKSAAYAARFPASDAVWEAAMFAPAQKLDTVTVMIDYNKWQATGRSDEIMALAPLAEKWRAFGWDACEVDGHDLDMLLAALARKPDGGSRPRAIVCHTVKGKGVSFMEDDNNWHYRIPTAEEVQKARVELRQS
ncbi:MAG: hypothetical protein EBY96_06630 [Actinobacteria bacterium]|nr:hypothetical protein [Actinomycetota bacterium]